MTKTLIAVPCMDMVHAKFMESFVNLIKPDGTSWAMVQDTLINEARNIFAANAVKAGFDRVFWLDSDMKFAPDTLLRLSEDMDKYNLDFVSGLYFTRRPPIKPVAFKSLWWDKKENIYYFDNIIVFLQLYSQQNPHSERLLMLHLPCQSPRKRYPAHNALSR